MSEDIQYDEVDGTRVVVGATLEKLIEKVASNEIPDKEFVEIFLITHTYFVDSFTLLENLSSKYLKSASAEDAQDRESLFVQMRLINVLKKWLQLGWLKYFAPNPELLSKVEEFVLRLKGGAGDKWHEALHRTIESLKDEEQVEMRITDIKLPKGSMELIIEMITCSMEPELVAKHFTYLEFELFRLIPIDELLHKAFNKEEQSPCYHSYINHFNQMSHWMSSIIVSGSSAKERGLTICRLLQVAKHFYEWNNFSGLMQIVSALTCTPVERLKLSWLGVPPKLLELFENDFKPICDPSGNYAKYREVFEKATLPYIPLAVVYTKDMLIIEENVPSRLEENAELINFKKMKLLGKTLLTVQSAQENPYKWPEMEGNFDSNLLSALRKLQPILGDKEMYAKSKAAEPSFDAASPKDLRKQKQLAAKRGSNLKDLDKMKEKAQRRKKKEAVKEEKKKAKFATLGRSNSFNSLAQSDPGTSHTSTSPSFPLQFSASFQSSSSEGSLPLSTSRLRAEKVLENIRSLKSELQTFTQEHPDDTDEALQPQADMIEQAIQSL
eukprot:CAMPEP_0177673342 /NCGR_PEP_ID=MMETSP0447-20121125/25890_1 /TAXON_ID=0 /ORGANISM="Stygamoeba regulata, Strain BSH-02190019" /LENGTH=553 /DNA_ID=CAMNT_0019181203 /DNA_START=126 /DNA_END=1784 /DNA_ORIENTATION=-